MNGLNHQGLTLEEADKRLNVYGANILAERKPPGLPVVFLRQFKSPFIYILLIAALVSYGLDEAINALFILVVLLLNALIGTFQEYSAERAAAALKKMVPSYATVIRGGKTIAINSADVVPGDIVQLVPGDRVPADLQLDTAHDLHLDESMLTGESVAIHKIESAKAPLNTCYAGTVVMRGRGLGEVIATGARTEIGRIASDVVSEQVKPPLLQRIERFTLIITYSILILVSLIFIITVIHGDDLGTAFLLAVALAVSAIPEGLPVAITVALAIGMRRMAKVNVIIRKLLAVEALGSCTYIASDKTGTLTVNEMTIREVVLSTGAKFEVSGEGMDLHGNVRRLEGNKDNGDLQRLCLAGLLSNEARLENIEGQWTAYGDMVDIAFLVLAEKVGLDVNDTRRRFSERGKIPYESENAFSASINRLETGDMLFVKGSVERLLTMCSNIEAGIIEAQAASLAHQGYRVLGVAYRELQTTAHLSPESELHDLSFIGMVGIIDPLRPEVFDAVRQCENSSIEVAMVTGDHPETAIILARQAGIADENMKPVTGKELAEAGQSGELAFRNCIQSTRVFARVSPHQKKQIVEELIEQGEFVAVTGDGVNDAPALSQAHVGIAMGLRGTDVARESSDLILADDHFSSIVQGIKQGRIVYNNIRKVIFLLISTGAAEIMLIMLSLLYGMPLPLFPLQLLWLNLVTNGIQDVALAFEPEEGDELNKPPRRPGERIFNGLMIQRVMINALVMGCIAFFVFKYQIDHGVNEDTARNMTLLLMVLFENVHVLNSRSETQSIFKQYFFGNKLLLFGMLGAQAMHIGAMYTPGLRDILQIQPVTLSQWSVLLSIALVLLVVNELHKRVHSIVTA